MSKHLCPSCNSTEIYFGKGADSEGLSDEQAVVVNLDGKPMEIDTYVCCACGYIQLFMDKDTLPRFASAIRKNKAGLKPPEFSLVNEARA